MFFSTFSIFISNRLNTSSKQGISTIGYKLGLLSITISTAFAIVSSLVIIGFHRSIETRISSLMGSINIVSQETDQESFDRRKLDFLQSSIPDDILSIKAVVHKHVLLESENLLEGVILYGLDNTLSHRNLEGYITHGRLPNVKKQQFENEVAVSQQLANKFCITLGSKILVYAINNNNNAIYRKLLVVGIYNTHLLEFDSQFVFCDIRLTQKLNGWNNNTVDCISCLLKHPKNNVKVAKYINANLNRRSLYARCIEEEYYDIFEWISVLYKNTIIFIVLLLIIVNTNLAAIIAMQVVDRLYTIRVLKAIGASIRQQMDIFIINNIIMVSKGVLYGNIFGVSVCALQYFTKIIKLNDSVYYIDHVPIVWEWSIIGIIDTVILFTTILILVLTHRIINSTKVINSHL
jgi:lipoprotein-releasing system permease protein